jgi:hypothetical protein
VADILKTTRGQIRLTDQILIVAVAVAFAYLANVGVTMHRRGFERWEIAATLGSAVFGYAITSWTALALIRHWRKLRERASGH